MFVDLDETLRQLLVERGGLNSGEIDISFDMPTRDWAASISKPTVSLYLYDIRENAELRNPTAWTVRPGPNNTAVKSRPDVRVDVTYRVTAFANAVEDEHRLLARVMLTLLQYPVLPMELLQGEITGQEIKTSAAQGDSVLPSPADYWGAMDNNIKPSIDFKATISLNLNQEITTGLALTSKVLLGRIENGNGMTDVKQLPYLIGGRVFRANDPEQAVAEAQVTLLERGLDTITDAQGRYQFSGLTEGRYTLVVTAPDLAEQRREIQVPGENYDVGL